jgi:hypothetical protein
MPPERKRRNVMLVLSWLTSVMKSMALVEDLSLSDRIFAKPDTRVGALKTPLPWARLGKTEP